MLASRRLFVPLAVYALIVYTLAAMKPETMFDDKTGLPKAFGTGAAPGTTIMPFWLAAFMAAYVSQHFVPSRY